MREHGQMRENMGKALQDYYNQRAEQELRWQLMHQAAATVEEQPTDEELDRMVEAQMETLTAQLAQKGLTLEAYCQFTGSDEKKMREDMRPDALEAFRTQKAVEKIAQLENLTVTEQDIEEEFESMAKQYEMEVSKVKELVPVEELTESLKTRKAVKLIVDSAVAVAPKAEEKTEE